MNRARPLLDLIKYIAVSRFVEKFIAFLAPVLHRVNKVLCTLYPSPRHSAYQKLSIQPVHSHVNTLTIETRALVKYA